MIPAKMLFVFSALLFAAASPAALANGAPDETETLEIQNVQLDGKPVQADGQFEMPELDANGNFSESSEMKYNFKIADQVCKASQYEQASLFTIRKLPEGERFVFDSITCMRARAPSSTLRTSLPPKARVD